MGLRLDDQPLLKEFAQSDDRIMRAMAITFLKDEAFIAQVVEDDKDEIVCEMAKRRLQVLQGEQAGE